MADAKPKAPPKGAPKKGAAGAGLKKKVGPLPLWAWVAIIGGGAAVYWFFIRSGDGGGEGDFGGPEIVTGAGGGYSPQQAASAGAPAENGALAGQIDPATLQALQDQLSAQVGDIRGHVTELEDAFASAGYSVNEDKSWNAPGFEETVDGGLESYVRSIIESYGGPQASPTPAAPDGVRWGGNIYTTRAGIARELGAHGVSYSDWARRHPGAAGRLTGPAPKPKPKPKPKPPRKPPRSKPPVHKQPPKKAPKKAPPKRKVPARRPPAKRAPARPSGRRRR